MCALRHAVSKAHLSAMRPSGRNVAQLWHKCRRWQQDCLGTKSSRAVRARVFHLDNSTLPDDEPVGLPDHATEGVAPPVIATHHPTVLNVIDLRAAIHPEALGIVHYLSQVVLDLAVRAVPRAGLRGRPELADTVLLDRLALAKPGIVVGVLRLIARVGWIDREELLVEVAVGLQVIRWKL